MEVTTEEADQSASVCIRAQLRPRPRSFFVSRSYLCAVKQSSRRQDDFELRGCGLKHTEKQGEPGGSRSSPIAMPMGKLEGAAPTSPKLSFCQRGPLHGFITGPTCHRSAQAPRRGFGHLNGAEHVNGPNPREAPHRPSHCIWEDSGAQTRASF